MPACPPADRLPGPPASAGRAGSWLGAAVCLALPATALADNSLPEVAAALELPAHAEAIGPDELLPEVRMGLIQHHGDLRGPELHRVVRQKLPHVTHCVDRMAQAGMPLQGTLHLHFVLLADGTPADLELNLGRIPLPEVEDCLHPLVARWPLPSDERLGSLDVQVDYLLDLPALDLDLVMGTDDDS
jgi:hypothetical protein